MDKQDLFKFIVDVPDFPKPGILFKDITPVLVHPGAFSSLIDELSKLVPAGTEKILAIESRGFILGAALAARRHLGLVIARKPGKLPRKTIEQAYKLEYGEDSLQLHETDLGPNDKVVVLDDVLATGGTAHAAETLALKSGANVLGHLFLLEIKALGGRKKLSAKASSLFEV